jgi:hypothetical protein
MSCHLSHLVLTTPLTSLFRKQYGSVITNPYKKVGRFKGQ